MLSYPSFSIVAAMTPEFLIGDQGRLPWHIPAELKGFRDLTWGGTLIMGRRTFTSLTGPLPGRVNFVVSSTLEPVRGVQRFPELAQALQAAQELGKRIYVIGGAQLYAAALPHAEGLVVSWVRGRFTGDVYFPSVLAAEWQLTACEHAPTFSRCAYRRKQANKNPGAQKDPGSLLQPPWIKD